MRRGVTSILPVRSGPIPLDCWHPSGARCTPLPGQTWTADTSTGQIEVTADGQVVALIPLASCQHITLTPEPKPQPAPAPAPDKRGRR